MKKQKSTVNSFFQLLNKEKNCKHLKEDLQMRDAKNLSNLKKKFVKETTKVSVSLTKKVSTLYV